MAKEQISAYVPRQTKLRIDKAAEVLGISTSKYIEQAVKADLDKLDIRQETHEARKQRDCFKAKFEEAQQKFTEATSKIEALQERGLLARLFNRNPTI